MTQSRACAEMNLFICVCFIFCAIEAKQLRVCEILLLSSAGGRGLRLIYLLWRSGIMI